MTRLQANNRTITTLALIVIVLAYLAASSGDYADQVERQNGALRAALARARLAADLGAQPAARQQHGER